MVVWFTLVRYDASSAVRVRRNWIYLFICRVNLMKRDEKSEIAISMVGMIGENE